ncbi:MAG: sigma-70 RNA polymerase sigma factor region 4 domain-containing protein [Planctomycetota bacterium]
MLARAQIDPAAPLAERDDMRLSCNPDSVYVHVAKFQALVRLYSRYVLIRSRKYAADDSDVEAIAVYTLITSCIIAASGKSFWPIGLILDCMIEIVGSDIADPQNKAGLRRQRFFADDGAQQMTEAINSLSGHLACIVVLRYIEMMSLEAIAQIHKKSVPDIAGDLSKANEHLSKWLKCSAPCGPALSAQDVAMQVCELGNNLDSARMQRMAEAALSCLAG